MKCVRMFFVALFPYLIIILFIISNTSLEKFLPDNIFIPLSIYIGWYFVALISAVITFVSGITNKRKSLEMLRINMIVKLIHVPAYLCIFVVGLGCMLTIFTFGITIIFILLDLMTIVLSGLIGLGGILRSLRENKISIKAAVIHGIFQFVFCADIISSIVLYRTVKATEYKLEAKLML